MSEQDKLPFKETIDELFQHNSWLHYHWLVYMQLFASEDRIDLFNKRSGTVFGVYQRVLWDDVLLEIAKLLSWRKQGSEVVSLHRAICKMPDQSKRNELENAFEAIRGRHAKFLNHRDQRIAHNDVKIAAKTETLDGISRAEVKEALAGIDELFNQIAEASGLGQFGFDGPSTLEHDVEALCRMLQVGIADNDRRNAEKRKLIL